MDFLLKLFSLSPYEITKIFLFLLEFMYIGFAFVLLRQENLMAQTVEIPVARFFKILTLMHLLGSAGVFILSLLIL